MRLIRLIIYLFFSIIFTSCDNEENILVQDAVKLLDQENVLFLDVRTSQEFRHEGSIKNALLIPVNEIEKKITMLEAYKSKSIIVYCRSGRRSQNATNTLIDLGYEDVTNLGGINDAAIFLDRNITE